MPYVTCSHGFDHPVCPLCDKAADLYQEIYPPIGGRDTRVRLLVCFECFDGVYNALDTVDKLRALLAHQKQGEKR